MVLNFDLVGWKKKSKVASCCFFKACLKCNPFGSLTFTPVSQHDGQKEKKLFHSVITCRDKHPYTHTMHMKKKLYTHTQ